MCGQTRHGWQERTLSIMASQRELKRLHVVQKVIEGTVSETEAAEMLSLSVRQTVRIVGRVREEGAKGVVHRLRGRESNRKLPADRRSLYRRRGTESL